MGRLPLHRLPGRIRGRAGQPQREAPHPVLPGAGRRPAPGAARPVRGRRRDRRRHRRRPRLRRPAAADPPGRVPHQQAGGRDPLTLRRLRPPGPRRREPDGPAVPRAPDPPRGGAGVGEDPSPPHARHRRPQHGRGLVRPLRGRRARRRDGQAARRAVRARQADPAEGQAQAHRGLRGRRLPHAQERRRRGLAPPRPLRRRRRPPQHGRGHQLQPRRGARSWSPRSPPTSPTPWSTTPGRRGPKRPGPSWDRTAT